MPLEICKCKDCDRCIFAAEMKSGICLACKNGFHSNSSNRISQK